MVTDGLYQVDFFTEIAFYNIVLNTLFFPRIYSTEHWLTIEEMIQAVRDNPYQYSWMTSGFQLKI